MADLSKSVPAIPLSDEELAKLKLTEAHRTGPTVDSSQATFVQHVLPAAEEVARQFQVPTEAIIAQWALESGWGQSQLASKYNNLGGIKAFNTWKGQKVDLPTFERNKTERITQPFRVYPTVNDYARDYLGILEHGYSKARGTNDARQFALRLGQAGYHQDDPAQYADKVAGIAERVRKLLPQ